jgi:hypothetical protein
VALPSAAAGGEERCASRSTLWRWWAMTVGLPPSSLCGGGSFRTRAGGRWWLGAVAVAFTGWMPGMAAAGGNWNVRSPFQSPAAGILTLKANCRPATVPVASTGADSLRSLEVVVVCRQLGMGLF